MGKIKKQLQEYFEDWKLNDDEKNELEEHISLLDDKLQFFQLMIEGIKNSEKQQAELIDTLDSIIQEDDTNVKTDT